MTIRHMTLGACDDFHLHLRTGELLRTVLPETTGQFQRALIMPNTKPEPVLSGADALRYRAEIKRLAPQFEPLMTIQLTNDTTPDTILDARRAGVIAAKLYPQGVTTNSENGVAQIRALSDVFAAMQDAEMALCLHGESPLESVFCLDQESQFLPALAWTTRMFPKLRVILEHITTKEAVQFVKALPETVAASITVHHLFLTLDDIVRAKLRPHHFCMPLPKRRSDRDALRAVVLEGNPKFFLGTDSAPHPVEQKECSEAAPGVFTAPVALPLLAQLFDEQDAASAALDAFVGRNGAQFYRLPRLSGSVTLRRAPRRIPEYYGTTVRVVPFKAGEILPWRVVD